jgi:hypothetical protein
MHVNQAGLDPWLAETLEATARIVAGAINVLGVRRLVITGRLTEIPACVLCFAEAVRQGSIWGRFGEVLCQTAPHRRAAGLVAVGLDRLVLPTDDEAGALARTLHTQTAA